MKPEIVDRLRRLNQEFYQSFSDSFSSTRGRIQPGVRQIMAEMPRKGHFLDIGCGNGNLAVELQRTGKTGYYLGLDFSEDLLAIARRKTTSENRDSKLKAEFITTDILHNEWPIDTPNVNWDVVIMFAVLHHIPGESNRCQLMESLKKLLPDGCPLYLSVWQIQNSPRLTHRIRDWSEMSIEENEVESGDVLMDWRAQSAENAQRIGFRYVHIFTEEELERMAKEAGYIVANQFYSDGKEGNLAFYQKWLKKK